MGGLGRHCFASTLKSLLAKLFLRRKTKAASRHSIDRCLSLAASIAELAAHPAHRDSQIRQLAARVAEITLPLSQLADQGAYSDLGPWLWILNNLVPALEQAREIVRKLTPSPLPSLRIRPPEEWKKYIKWRQTEEEMFIAVWEELGQALDDFESVAKTRPGSAEDLSGAGSSSGLSRLTEHRYHIAPSEFLCRLCFKPVLDPVFRTRREGGEEGGRGELYDRACLQGWLDRSCGREGPSTLQERGGKRLRSVNVEGEEESEGARPELNVDAAEEDLRGRVESFLSCLEPFRSQPRSKWPELVDKCVWSDTVNLEKPKMKVPDRIYECDGCGLRPITGVRWRCDSCAVFDMCAECHAFAQNGAPLPRPHAPTHAMTCVPILGHAPASASKTKENAVAAPHYTCRNCSKLPILGRRWHCQVCIDFDLCDHCNFDISKQGAGCKLPYHTANHDTVATPIYHGKARTARSSSKVDRKTAAIDINQL